MSVERFVQSPWRTQHHAYENSPFNIKPAPENCISEITISSLYRASGFPGVAESDVTKNGRELDRQSRKDKNRDQQNGKISQETWRTIIHGILESPKQPKQSSKRFLQLCPIVPDVSLYSGSARLAGNPWNPGALIQKIIQLGACSDAESHLVWDRLFCALSVTDKDDVWAKWLEEEFLSRRSNGHVWKKSELKPLVNIPDAEKALVSYPAKQFVTDLDAIIQAKGEMTRRQWISLLEAFIRLGAVSHIFWLCRVHEKLWKVASSILGFGSAPIPSTNKEVLETLIAGENRYLSYGKPFLPIMRDSASRYLTARLGLNIVLIALKELGVEIQSLASSADISDFIQAIIKHKPQLSEMGVMDSLFSVLDAEAKTISCKKGIGSNLMEFCRYNLGQRVTANETQRGYDQGYFLQKKGGARNSPWIISMGPVAVLATVHCCLKEVKGPRSVHRLSEHLGLYGLEVGMDDLSIGDLGRKLRMLGLVLDSPDAESGMLLVPPFGYEVQE